MTHKTLSFTDQNYVDKKRKPYFEGKKTPE